MKCEIYNYIERKLENGSPHRITIDKDVWLSLKKFCCGAEIFSTDSLEQLRNVINYELERRSQEIMKESIKESEGNNVP